MEDARGLRDFIRVPARIQADDPHWIAPLFLEQKERFSDKNPFFRHARWRAWTAWRDGRPVGRISAQIDRLHLERFDDATGFFGCIEAIDDAGVFRALFARAEAWLREQGMQRARGPFNLSINEESGLLVGGFDSPPRVMMGHNPPYYGARVEEQGYAPVKDLLAYHQPPILELPPGVKRLLSRTKERIRVRPLQRKQLARELELLRDIFNDAWAENWGFVPMTREEFDNVGKAMTLLMDDDFVQIAELDGEAAAMIVALPDVNQAIRDLDGRLLPLGWLKLLWRLKVRYPDQARIILMGVRRKWQRTRYGPTLAFAVIKAIKEALARRDMRDVEMSWILENNQGTRNIIEQVGGELYKRYRLYEKSLTESQACG
ncbi:MAG TPA: N-acetyltransferase [Gammaproteobacteria bacterium]|nr:N-acetyltransferase [Gammaproteobacteria bacterium]